MNDRVHWDGLSRLRALAPVRALGEIASSGIDVALVGGAIRDALLGRAAADLDFVVAGDLEAVLEAVAAVRGRRPVSIGDRFQETHRCRWHGHQVDLARSLGTVEEDLARRDFTINALALPLGQPESSTAELLDPCDGVADLIAGTVRAVAASNIAADPLRVMRGIRYAHTLPGFGLADDTCDVLRSVAVELQQVAPERVADEWQALLQSERWRGGVAMAWDLGVGEVTLGRRLGSSGVDAWGAHEAQARETEVAVAGESAGPRETDRLLGRLTALLYDVDMGSVGHAAGLRERRWPRRLANAAAAAAAWARSETPGSDALVEWALDRPRVAAVAGRLRSSLGKADGTELCTYAARADEPRWVDGERLLELGMSAGPQLGAILRQVAHGQLRRRWVSADAADAWVVARLAR